MTLVNAISLACSLFMLVASPAYSFYLDGACPSAETPSATTTLNTTFPTGLQKNDLVVDVIYASNTSAVSLSPSSGWTLEAPQTFSTSNQMVIATHVYTATMGDTAPQISLVTAGTIAYVGCAYWGVSTTSPVDQFASSPLSSTTVITAPNTTGTPSTADEEALMVYLSLSASNAIDTTAGYQGYSTLTTNSQTTAQVQDALATYTAAPTIAIAQTNLGPGTPAKPGAQSLTFTTAADGAAATLVLNHTPYKPLKPLSGSASFANTAGLFYYLPAPNPTPPSTFDATGLSQPFVDGLAFYTNLANLEPACGIYSFDFTDNEIANARILGKVVSWGMPVGNVTPNPSFTSSNMSPPWLQTATSCSNNTTPVTVSTVWVKNFAYIICGENDVNVPYDASYQSAVSSAISTVGARYGNNPALVAIKDTGIGLATPEAYLRSGPENQSETCNGSVPQCESLGLTCSGMPETCQCSVSETSKWNAGGYNLGTPDPSTPTGGVENAAAYFEQKWSAAFPNQILTFMTVASSNPMPQSTPDTFNQDMITYHQNTYAGSFMEMNGALGWSMTGSDIFVPTYLPFRTNSCTNGVAKCAGEMIGLQTVGAEADVTGASCAAGAPNGPYSTANTQCLTPSVYAAMQANPATLSYYEIYRSDIDSTVTPPVQPWLQLLHQFATGQLNNVSEEP